MPAVPTILYPGMISAGLSSVLQSSGIDAATSSVGSVFDGKNVVNDEDEDEDNNENNLAGKYRQTRGLTNQSSFRNSSTTNDVGNNLLAGRPPLPPPCYNHLSRSRPTSRAQLTSASSMSTLSTRSPSPNSCSLSSSASYRARSLSASRSPSFYGSHRYSRLDTATSSSLSTPPRRIFPRENFAIPRIKEEVSSKEQAPVVFDASLNFVLGCDKQRVRQSFRPTASHLEPTTASSCLTNKISQFLKRTDHIMEEWRSLGHRDDAEEELNSYASTSNIRDKSRVNMGRSQSATNIMIRGFQYYSRSGSSRTKSPSSRRSDSRASEDRTLSDGPGRELTGLARTGLSSVQADDSMEKRNAFFHRCYRNP